MPRVVVAAGQVAAPPLAEASALADLVPAGSADELADALPGADALLLWDTRLGTGLDPLLPSADRLGWVHLTTAGVEHVLTPGLRAAAGEGRVSVTNSRGVYDTAMAEYVVGLLLAHLKDLPGTWRRQHERQWEHRATRTLRGYRVGVVGSGSIGRTTARMLRALAARVTLVGRVAADDAEFGRVVAAADLVPLARDLDALVLAAPLTPGTRGLVDAAVLDALGPDGYLVNIGRGPLVVEADLVEALSAGRIAGAALDVFDVEPLPADSPLWSAPAVVVSPHMSGDYVGFQSDLAALFCDNLRRLVAGEPLRNVVDPAL
ncbi:MAG: D-2-hydroxyacid dehydrogenase, partial [Frankia sp.]|nr:D-2-hydroxyacid dehydrogenase [Frankia sp.]